MSASAKPETQPGVAVDAHGGAVIDPTSNVLDLVKAAVMRLDDLRAAETRRQDDLRQQSEKHAAEIGRITAAFQEQLREAEAKRIDAIRAVDVNAVAVASARASDQAAVLATQVTQSADGLRTLVSTTASTMAAQQAAASAEFSKRLSELERTKYEGAGRSGVTDPERERLAALVERLATAQSTGAGKVAGASALWGWIVGAIGATVAVLTLVEKLGK